MHSVESNRRRLAADLVAELDRLDKRIKTADAELGELVVVTGSTLLELFGIGPPSAACLLERHSTVGGVLW